MTLQITMLILGIIFIAVGFIGCIVPALPGPLLSYAAIILISIPGDFLLFKPVLLIILGGAAILSQFLDNVFPILASKKAGAGKAGIWGSVAGMIIGMIFFPPLGVILGAFFGALLGEMLFNKENRNPLKAALGVFSGTLFGILVKLIVSGIITCYFIIGVGKLF